MAYNVSDKYREVIYSGDAQNTAKLTINGTTIPTSNIKKITISSPMYDSSQKTFSLGNFISQQVTIEFRNVDNVPIEGQVHLEIGTKIDNEYEYVPIGDFIIESNPEDFYKKCKLTCLDKAVLMKSNVDYSSIVPTTVETLLKWLCTYFNIEIGTYPNINRDVTINVYDNTLSGKQYISYIAEMMGGNAKIGRDGKLYIIPLKGKPVVTINAKKSKSFTKGETYEISRVVYESAISKFEYGEDTKNTLYIRQDNMFLTKTEEVEAIYNSVVGTKICSLKTENYGDVSLDSWDYIKYTLGEEEYITYNSNTITYQMNIASKVEVSIPTKNQQETTNVVGGNDKEKIRRLETNINQIEGTITILNEEIDGQNKKIAEIEITNEQIQQSVTKAEESIVELQKAVEVFVPTIEPDLVLVPTFDNGLPKVSTEFFVEYSAKFEGEDVTPIVTSQSENEGITLSITDKLTFTVNSSVAIPNKDNKYELLFTYTKDEVAYTKTMILYLMRVNENEDLSERLEQVEKDLNNNYPNNDELNEALEGQKATIIEETSTMIEQSASEVTTSIINKVNTDGVTTLKNTLVTIDINGINVAKNDEDVVSLLDNKGLYVSDGKLKEDESNLLMKTDRNGAYFKSAIIDGTIKEQGLFQKEIIEDDDFGKGQAGFWIGG